MAAAVRLRPLGPDRSITMAGACNVQPARGPPSSKAGRAQAGCRGFASCSGTRLTSNEWAHVRAATPWADARLVNCDRMDPRRVRVAWNHGIAPGFHLRPVAGNWPAVHRDRDACQKERTAFGLMEKLAERGPKESRTRPDQWERPGRAAVCGGRYRSALHGSRPNDPQTGRPMRGPVLLRSGKWRPGNGLSIPT
jgi:hypothetical protein